MLASSKAGHDKKTVYVIIEEDKEYVYLADGKTRPLTKPKKKNKKHIQIIKRVIEPEIVNHIKAGQADDIEIRKMLAKYEAWKKQEVVN